MENVKAQEKSGVMARLVVLCAAIIAMVAAFAPQVFAQGCAMCYQSAAASGQEGREALRHGILVLLFPTLGVFVGIFGLIFSRRKVSR
jgi:hypothetical protein